MRINQTVLLTILTFISLVAYSQSEKLPFSQGLVTDRQGRAIEGAHVLIKGVNIGAITDSMGHFWIPLKKEDTLYVMHVSYETELFPVKKYLTEGNSFLFLSLTEASYTLKPVTIYAFPSNWEEFKLAVKNLHLPEEPEKPNLYLPGNLQTPPNISPGSVGISIGGPIQYLYDQFSQTGRSKRKLAMLTANDKKNSRVFTRYNPTLIYRLTGLKDPKQVEAFMDYCKLDSDFILKASDYDLYKAILECFSSFSTENS
jgi:hypothetical protein